MVIVVKRTMTVIQGLRGDVAAMSVVERFCVSRIVRGRSAVSARPTVIVVVVNGARNGDRSEVFDDGLLERLPH